MNIYSRLNSQKAGTLTHTDVGYSVWGGVEFRWKKKCVIACSHVGKKKKKEGENGIKKNLCSLEKIIQYV